MKSSRLRWALTLSLIAAVAIAVSAGAQQATPPPTEKTAPASKPPKEEAEAPKPARRPQAEKKPGKGTFQPSEKIPADVPSAIPTDI